MLVAFEGIDGSGKGTQTSLLLKRARQEGQTADMFSFPGYTANAFGQAVGRYLNGDFGDVSQVAPQLAAVLYAGDRYATKDSLLASCSMHSLVICDRYVPSNLAHQAAKLDNRERSDFIQWLSEIEYGIYDLPRAALVFYLDMPIDRAAELVSKKRRRDYTSLKADIHERDAEYLARCRDVYEQLIESDRESDWCRIRCASGNRLRDPCEIGDEIWQMVVHQLTVAETSA